MVKTRRASVLSALVLAPSLFDAASAADSSYFWPNVQYEQLEGFLYEGSNINGVPTSALTQNCLQRGGQNSTTVAAEWLRLAYHDSATHNITDGTGGLDASVYYELDRSENTGTGNQQTMLDLGGSSNRYISRADVIAIAAIWGIASCKGPVLPFHAGRVDALKAGPAGVPEPQQDLKTHTERFRLQGFSPTEMIALVACGHTLGGVRNADFPTIVPPTEDGDPADRLSNVHTFDTGRPFDHRVVSEYLEGTTQNPLVVNKNETVLSDLRIFSSDGNATVSSMRTLESFHQTCAPLLTRMLNTVPSSVTLTEEITPIPFKVTKAEFSLSKGKLTFTTRVRILEKLSPQALTSTSRRDVRMFWCERRGPHGGCANDFVMTAFKPTINYNIASPPTFGFSPVTGALGLAFSSYEFMVPVEFERSVGAFWFEVRDGGEYVLPSEVRIENNGGRGYWAPDDEVVYVPVPFNVKSPGDIPFADVGANRPYYIAAGIHNSTSPVTAHVHLFDNTIVGRTASATGGKGVFNTTLELKRNRTMTPVAGYTFYSAEVNTRGVGLTADFDVIVTSLASPDGSTGDNGTHRKHIDFVRMIPAETASLPVDPPVLATFGNTDLRALSNGSLSNNVFTGDAVGFRVGLQYGQIVVLAITLLSFLSLGF